MTMPYWLQVAAGSLLLVWVLSFIAVPILRRLIRPFVPLESDDDPPRWPLPWFTSFEAWTCPKCGAARREEHRSVFIGELGLTVQDTTPELRPCPGCGYVRDMATLAVCRACGAEHAEATFLTPGEHGIRLAVRRCPTCMHLSSPPSAFR